MVPCHPCDGGVTSLTLRYNGSVADARIVADDGDELFNGIVQPGETFTFSGQRSDGRMSSNVDIFVNGEEVSSFHTSCSQPIGPGTTDGDFAVVSGTSRDGGPLCRGSSCEDGKPCQLTLRYTGHDCSVTTHGQDPGKVRCSGDPAFASPVIIRASDKEDPNDNGALVWFEGEVELDQTFAIQSLLADEDRLKNETHVHIFDTNGNLLQQIEFHTSCSQPLVLGDRFGGVRLEGFTVEGTCDIPPGGDQCRGGRKPRVLVMEYTGDDCSATSHSQDPGKVSCDGDPMGAPLVMIRASDSADPNDGGARVYFRNSVPIGQTFDIDAGMAMDSRLQNNTYVHVFDPIGGLLQTVKFHTSCSQPLLIGDQFGSVRLTAFMPE